MHCSAFFSSLDSLDCLASQGSHRPRSHLFRVGRGGRAVFARHLLPMATSCSDESDIPEKYIDLGSGSWRRMLGFGKKKSDEEKVTTPEHVETCVVCDLLHHRAGAFWKDAAKRRKSQSGASGRESPSRLSRQLLAAVFTLQIGSTMYAAMLFLFNGLQFGAAVSGPASFHCSCSYMKDG